MSDTTSHALTDASLEQWLSHLMAIHPNEIDMGLSRVSQVAQQLDVLTFPHSQVITVAGTNGKGTTCAMLEAILLAADKSVGVYSSPHIHHFNERYRINQQDADDALIIKAFNAIEIARGDISLTYFEFATLAALWIFKQTKPDVILLEVGLGGRLDATNIVDSIATVITSIDIDHQEYLGDTRELVGREKAGVMRPHCLSVIGEPNLPQSVTDYAQQIASQTFNVGTEFSYSLQQDNQSWQFCTSQQILSDLPVPKLPLPNAATCVALVTQLWPDISLNQIKQGLKAATLPGRIEQVSSAPLILMDVAHNPHAAKYLAQQLSQYSQRKVHALCGMLQDKDITEVLACLTDTIDKWHVVSLDNPRGASATQLAQALNSSTSAPDSVSQFETMQAAWSAIQTTIEPDDVLIVFGSFFTVAAFHALIKNA